MFKEFKEFIARGNVLDLAVGVILGGAFGGIVNSFVNDILMPPIGRLVGGVDFNNLFINLSDKNFTTLREAKAAGAATINYGVFANTVINFLIVSFVIFLVVKQANRLRRPAEAQAPATTTTKDCPYCLSAIPRNAVRCAHCTSDLKT